jgi:hypothetical protein
LSSTFTALWSDSMYGIISIFLYLLRLAFTEPFYLVSL